MLQPGELLIMFVVVGEQKSSTSGERKAFCSIKQKLLVHHNCIHPVILRYLIRRIKSFVGTRLI